MKRAMGQLGTLVAVPVAMEHRFDHIDLLLGTPGFSVFVFPLPEKHRHGDKEINLIYFWLHSLTHMQMPKDREGEGEVCSHVFA